MNGIPSHDANERRSLRVLSIETESFFLMFTGPSVGSYVHLYSLMEGDDVV